MKGSQLFVISLVLVLGLGLALAEDNSTDNETETNETEDDFECVVDADCEVGEICVNGECEEDEVEEDENESEVEDEDENETKEKRGLGHIIRGRVKAGVYTSESGEQIRVREMAQNRMALSFGDDEVEVETELEVEEETENGTTKLRVKLNNGRNAEVKIMPNAASEKALERLRLKTCSEENNCTIELKEVGKLGGNESRLGYEVQIERHSRVLGIFKAKMKVRTQVDAENGEIIKVNKPWWAFIATEPAEE
jgi:DNA uptake protein ComE-like DNA-binding protein